MAEEVDFSAPVVLIWQPQGTWKDVVILYCCRDVTTERKMYPSFAPDDFPAVYEASQKALQTAALANSRQPDSTARPHLRISSCLLPLEDHQTSHSTERVRMGHESAMCYSDSHCL